MERYRWQLFSVNKNPFYSLHERFNNCVDGLSEDLTGEFIILFFLTHHLLSWMIVILRHLPFNADWYCICPYGGDGIHTVPSWTSSGLDFGLLLLIFCPAHYSVSLPVLEVLLQSGNAFTSWTLNEMEISKVKPCACKMREFFPLKHFWLAKCNIELLNRFYILQFLWKHQAYAMVCWICRFVFNIWPASYCDLGSNLCLKTCHLKIVPPQNRTVAFHWFRL
jgi:hypothetical protein